MRQLGSLMMFLGFFAIGLDFLDRVPTFLFWIYNWGDSAAWGIKIGFIVIGAGLWFFGKPGEAETDE
ncbi:MAG: hypothetical protein KAT26_02425 [Marinosulfonomonas sp.]|nr:hypothetical protein [Marinosulfonomonas sp.]